MGKRASVNLLDKEQLGFFDESLQRKKKQATTKCILISYISKHRKE